MNLEWISDFLEKLPEQEKTRKNLIEIAGYPKWENVNSNILAFYFDETEEHGFQRLFLDSLIEVYNDKNKGNEPIKIPLEATETEFVVEREVTTDSGKRIDIVIQDDSETDSEWAIIIENKIYAGLYNDLGDYWGRVSAKKKYGIVLSVSDTNIDHNQLPNDAHYTCILHKELVEQVQNNLHQYFIDADDRHLMFLKDYISNIQNHYENKQNTQVMNDKLKILREKYKEIQTLHKTENEALRYVSKIVFSIMDNIGYPPYTRKDTSMGKHFHINAENENYSEVVKNNLEIAKMLRFWINLDTLRYTDEFEGVFELWSTKHTAYGSELKKALRKKNIFTPEVVEGSSGSDQSGYQHIYYIKFKIEDLDELDFNSALTNSFNKHFLAHKNDFMNQAILELKNIVESKPKS